MVVRRRTPAKSSRSAAVRSLVRAWAAVARPGPVGSQLWMFVLGVGDGGPGHAHAAGFEGVLGEQRTLPMTRLKQD